jgi:hypothetical protein
MLEIKSIRQKDAPNFCKWEAETHNNEYVIIRYKDSNLDVRIAKSYKEFVLGKHRAIYRDNLEREDNSNISLEEIIEILGLDMSKVDYY